MSDSLKNAIQSAISADSTEFKNNIIDALNSKVSEKLQLAKVEYASSVFDDEEENTPEEETSNEEI